MRDLIIIGAGPSGLVCSIWRFRRTRRSSVGNGFAWGSGRFKFKNRKLLGIPHGIPGQELAVRAYIQAQKFGAEILITKGIRLHCDHKPYAVEVENRVRIPARTVVIATGVGLSEARMRKIADFEGAGVDYVATPMEAQLCQGEEVIVIGGGNVAGQAAVFLAESAERIHMLVRSASLVDKMSRYLIRRIEETPKIVFRPYTEIIALQGDDHLESVSGETIKRD